MRHLYYFGSIIVLGVVFVSGFSHYTFAQANEPPVIISIVVSTSAYSTNDDFTGGYIDLTPGADTTIFINGVVADPDGQGDIVGVQNVFYRSGVTGGQTCTTDAEACYSTSCQTVNNADPKKKDFACKVDLKYIAGSTDAGGRYPTEIWKAYVAVSDAYATTEDYNTIKEINSVLSVDIPVTIDFASLDPLSFTDANNNVEMIITQQGNVQADVEVSMATDMTCSSIGSIPLENNKWSLIDVAYDNQSAIPLTTSAVDTDLFVAYGTDYDPAPTKTLFWNILIPAGTLGACTGETTIVTIAH